MSKIQKSSIEFSEKIDFTRIRANFYKNDEYFVSIIFINYFCDKNLHFFYFHILGKMENDFLQKSQQKYYCTSCDYTTCNIYDFNKHNSTRKHKNNENFARMEINGNKKNAENAKKSQVSITYTCNSCNFITMNKSNYNMHLLTKKHKQNSSQVEEIDNKNLCTSCNKAFKNASGLWKHKQKCNPSEIKREPDIKNTQNTMLNENSFMELLKTNKELQHFLMEQHNTMMEQNTKLLELAKAGSNGSMNNSHNNSHNTTNNQFNLNFFLNETCKDAMNITDFINSLKVTIEDFENTGKLGYIEGISRIIINRLKGLDTNKRPVHCTDAKRETLYVRDQDAWEKDSVDKIKLKTAVKQVARMNLSQLPKWQKENPESEILDTRQNDEYIRYSMVALGGNGEDEEDKFIDKITKNVLREVIIDKDSYKTPVTICTSQVDE
jgi:hypothetical protein